MKPAGAGVSLGLRLCQVGAILSWKQHGHTSNLLTSHHWATQLLLCLWPTCSTRQATTLEVKPHVVYSSSAGVTKRFALSGTTGCRGSTSLPRCSTSAVHSVGPGQPQLVQFFSWALHLKEMLNPDLSTLGKHPQLWSTSAGTAYPSACQHEPWPLGTLPACVALFLWAVSFPFHPHILLGQGSLQ